MTDPEEEIVLDFWFIAVFLPGPAAVSWERFGGFHKWGSPQMDGLYWFIRENTWKWMMTGGTPSVETHILGLLGIGSDAEISDWRLLQLQCCKLCLVSKAWDMDETNPVRAVYATKDDTIKLIGLDDKTAAESTCWLITINCWFWKWKNFWRNMISHIHWYPHITCHSPAMGKRRGCPAWAKVTSRPVISMKFPADVSKNVLECCKYM